MKYDELSALTPVVRKEVITGELNRQIKDLNLVPEDEINDIVESIAGLTLSVVVQTVGDSNKLREQVELRAKNLLRNDLPGKSDTPLSAASRESTTTSELNEATASAPEHPSTPISVSVNSSPPRTSSPSGSVAPLSERERIFAAVSKLENTRQTELTDLLMGLPKRERAMCLFNPEVMRLKLVDAKVILESEDDEDEVQQTPISAIPAKIPTPAPVAPAVPSTPVKPPAEKIEEPATPKTKPLEDTPPTAEAPPKPPVSAPSPAPGPVSSQTWTIASLAKLPAAEIVRLATMSSSTGLPLPKADPLVVQATDEFIDSILDQTILVQKQKLGDKLYKIVKSFGVKTAVGCRTFLALRNLFLADFFLLAKGHHRASGSRGSTGSRPFDEQLPSCAQGKGAGPRSSQEVIALPDVRIWSDTLLSAHLFCCFGSYISETSPRLVYHRPFGQFPLAHVVGRISPLLFDIYFCSSAARIHYSISIPPGIHSLSRLICLPFRWAWRSLLGCPTTLCASSCQLVGHLQRTAASH